MDLTPAEIAGLDTFEQILDWASLTGGMRTSLLDALGTPISTIELEVILHDVPGPDDH